MGTLNQPPRDYKRLSKLGIEDLISEIRKVAKDHKLDFDQTLRIYELAEQRRRNDLFVANGEIHDEQLYHLGDIFSEISMNLKDLSRD